MDSQAQSGAVRDFRRRLVLWAALTVLPLLGLAFYQSMDERREAIQRAHADALEAARLVAHEQDRLVQDARLLLSVLAQMPDLRSADRPRCDALLTGLLKQHQRYVNLGVTGADGSVRCSALPVPPGINLADRRYVADALGTGRFAVGEYQVGRITGVPSINFGFPILASGDNKVHGVVFAALSLAWLNDYVAGVQLPAGSLLVVLDSRRTVLAAVPPEGLPVGTHIDAEIPSTPPVRPQAVSSIPVGGESRYWVWAPLVQGGSVVTGIGIPETLIAAQGGRSLRRNLLVLFITMAAVLGFAWSGGDRLILRRFRRAQEEASTDVLTGLHNRRYLTELATRAVGEGARVRSPVSLIVLDIDHFKKVNDRHGHPAGDKVLKAIARCCRASVRTLDILARYGGEEFCILLPNSGRDTAAAVAERLRELVSRTPVPGPDGSIHVTISCGVAETSERVRTFTTLMEQADAALYRAKREGRNRVIVAAAVSPTTPLTGRAS